LLRLSVRVSSSYSFFSIFFLRTLRPPSSTLFPYTTLFRSRRPGADAGAHRGPGRAAPRLLRALPGRQQGSGRGAHRRHAGGGARSEEHTSELQSQSNLVCRLLLEKKKKHTKSKRTS